MSSFQLTPDALARALSQRTRHTSWFPGRSAAVLVPLCNVPSHNDASITAPHVVLTRRTETVPTHKGQYAFPGGKRDPDDASLVDTALREAHEEVGLVPSDVRVLGLLDDLTTSSGFVVTPVVGWIPHPYEFVPNPREVDIVVSLPLQALMHPVRARTLLREGLRRLTLAYDIDGHFVWGATASILRRFTALLRDSTVPVVTASQ